MFYRFAKILLILSALHALGAQAQAPMPTSAPTPVPTPTSEYTLGAGDSIRVLVFQNPDLTVETRVSEAGTITFPLIGTVELGGMSIGASEKKIADALVNGGFVRRPQVNIVLLQIRGNQVTVLGQVNKPGRFPLETFNMRVSDLLAAAGGAVAGSANVPGGGDTVVVTGLRDGKPFRKEIDIPLLYSPEKSSDDIVLMAGDSIYVPRAPVFYIYGEAQRPGVYRLDRGMTLMQALATGGGPTQRGTERKVKLHRKNAVGVTQELSPAMTDQLLPDDVIYVRESLF